MPRIPYSGCPLCNAPGLKLLATANCTRHALYVPEIEPVMNWMQCQSCDHVFTDGYFSPEQNEALFKKAHPNQLPGYEMERGRMLSARIVERVADHIQLPYPKDFSSKSWLDIGFGDGALLMTAKEWGFRVAGIDKRPEAIERLSDFGISATATSLNSIEGPYNVISMADVLEHTEFPKEILETTANLMQYGGVLFVSCPNRDTAAWRALTATGQNPYWAEVEHFHNFTRTRLTKLLEETGFQVLHYGISERYRLGMEILARKV